MSTTWTLSAQAVITDAMQIMNVLGQDETPDAADFDVCMKVLQGILKELPIHGLSWPKITTEPTLLVWDSLVPDRVSMPSDYFGVPDISFTQNSQRVQVRIVSKAEFEQVEFPQIKNPPRPYVRKMYIGPDNIGRLLPVPVTDPLLYITYQAIVVDANQITTPDVVQSWIAGLGMWLAYEASIRFAVPPKLMQEIEKRWLMKRALMLGYGAETAPICMQVAD